MPFYRIDNQNIFYIHIPRTGGSSVKHFFQYQEVRPEGERTREIVDAKYKEGSCPYGPLFTHATCDVYKDWEEVRSIDYCFTIFRDPVKRFASDFCMVEYTRPKYFNIKEKIYNVDLNLFFQNIRNDPLRFYHDPAVGNHFRPQVDFLPINDSELFQKMEIFCFEKGVGNVLKKMHAKFKLSKKCKIFRKKNTVRMIARGPKEKSIFFKPIFNEEQKK